MGRSLSITILLFAIALSSFAQEVKVPEYPGGLGKLDKYVKQEVKNFDWPMPPNKTGNSVHVQFTISKDGHLKDITIMEGLGDPFDAEAIRIIKNMPGWNSGDLDLILTKEINFLMILQKDINNANIKFEYGIVLFEKEEYKKASEQFAKAIKFNPYNLYFYFNRAIAHLKMERPTDACADLLYIKNQDTESLKLYQAYCR